MAKSCIVFIHGMFVTNQCWTDWKNYFEERGYKCFAPPWPLKDASPEELRKRHPDIEGEGSVRLNDIVSSFEKFITSLEENPILIGHSMGGLVTQILLNKGIGSCGVVIDSAPPQGVFTSRFSFLKANWPVVNPFSNSRMPALWTKEQFRYAFAAHLQGAELDAAYRNVVPQSKLVPRDSLTSDARIDYDKNKAPSSSSPEETITSFHPRSTRQITGSTAIQNRGQISGNSLAGHTTSSTTRDGKRSRSISRSGWLTSKNKLTTPYKSPIRRKMNRPSYIRKRSILKGSSKPRSSISLTFHPLTQKSWGLFEQLMGERGGCGGCWCMSFRITRKEFDENKYDGNKRLMKQLVGEGKPVGLVALLDGEPVGWVALSPREDFLRIENARTLNRIDDKPVWSIPCFFVRKEYRRMGISQLLIRGAVDFARKKKITTLEAYPVIPYSEKMPDAFLWIGALSAFKKNRFNVVQRNGKSKAIVRRDI